MRVADTGDWRLTNQESYLHDRTLRWSKWKAYRPGWDHDHCAFCWTKFGESVGGEVDFDIGWVTADDDYHWVCPTCFDDFHAGFAWVAEGPPAEQ